MTDPIKACGRIAPGVLCIAVPCRRMVWDGEKLVEGEDVPPHLFVFNGRMTGEFLEEECGEEWVLPDGWQAQLIWRGDV